MRKTMILALAAMIIVSCAKKVAPVSTTPMNAELTAAKETYESNCGKCHKLKNPNSYTATEWVPHVNRMAVKAYLSDTEKAQVMMYVQAFAKK